VVDGSPGVVLVGEVVVVAVVVVVVVVVGAVPPDGVVVVGAGVVVESEVEVPEPLEHVPDELLEVVVEPLFASVACPLPETEELRTVGSVCVCVVVVCASVVVVVASVVGVVADVVVVDVVTGVVWGLVEAVVLVCTGFFAGTSVEC
jgi:hypothetical protein